MNLIFPAYMLNIVTRYRPGQDRLVFICSMFPRAITYTAYLQDFIEGMVLPLSVERRQRSKAYFITELTLVYLEDLLSDRFCAEARSDV